MNVTKLIIFIYFNYFVVLSNENVSDSPIDHLHRDHDAFYENRQAGRQTNGRSVLRKETQDKNKFNENEREKIITNKITASKDEISSNEFSGRTFNFDSPWTSVNSEILLHNCNFLNHLSGWDTILSPHRHSSTCVPKINHLSVMEQVLHNIKFICLLYKSDAANVHATDDLEITMDSNGYRMLYIASEGGNLMPHSKENLIKFEIKPNSYLRLVLYEYEPELGLPRILSINLNKREVCGNHQKNLIRDWIKTTIKHSHQPIATKIDKPKDSGQNAKTENKIQCGVKQMKHREFILNGETTNPGDWPWHSAIYLRKQNLKYICGGTLISNRVVLTAAHCVYENDDSLLIPERVSVYLGHHHLNRFPSHTKEYEVFSIIPHEEYNFTSMHNDIAILKLATVVVFTNHIFPSCLPHPNFDMSKKVGKTLGWGTTETGEMASALRSGNMPVIPPVECLESNRDFFGMFMFETNFCAGFRNDSNVCPGDSGGGMFFQYGDQKWHLHGIVSLGMRSEDGFSCEKKEYVLFTDVAKYDEWIRGHLK